MVLLNGRKVAYRKDFCKNDMSNYTPNFSKDTVRNIWHDKFSKLTSKKFMFLRKMCEYHQNHKIPVKIY